MNNGTNGVGYQRAVADAAVLASGRAVVVYGANMVSGGTAGVLVLRDGTSTAGTAVVTLTGTISSGVSFDFGGNGVVFPNGCFADKDANVSAFTVFFEAL